MISILLAFWIEASWEKSKERKEVDEILAGLERQFENQLGQLEWRANHCEILSANAMFLLESWRKSGSKWKKDRQK